MEAISTNGKVMNVVFNLNLKEDSILWTRLKEKRVPFLKSSLHGAIINLASRGYIVDLIGSTVMLPFFSLFL